MERLSQNGNKRTSNVCQVLPSLPLVLSRLLLLHVSLRALNNNSLTYQNGKPAHPPC